MNARRTVGLLVIATLGVVWEVVPASQTSGWQIVDLEPGVSQAPDLAIDAAGNTVAVWINATRTRTATFAPSTASWSPALTLSNQGDFSSEPRVGSNATGDAVAVWRSVRSSDATPYLAASRYSSTTKTWLNILELPTKGYQPRALIDGTGNITVVWLEFLRDEGFYYGWVHEVRSVHFDAATASWSSPVTLSGDYAWQLDTVIDGAGNVTAAWGRLQFVESTRWSPNTKTWSPVTPIFTGNVYTIPHDYSPQLVADAEGNVIAVLNNFSRQLVGARFSAGTQTWSPSMLVASEGSLGSPASLGVDGNGNAMLVYVARQGAAAGVLGSRIYLTSTNVWSAFSDIASDVVPGSARLAVDSRGNSTAAWLSPANALRAAHRPFDGQWGVDPSTDVAAEAPRIAADATGMIHLLWSRNALPSGLRAGRLNKRAAPTIRRVTSSRATLAIDFTPVLDATDYEYSTNAGATWTSRASPSTQSPIVVGGLIDGVAYSLRLRAITVAGPGPPSNLSIATPGLAPPTNLRVATQLGNSVTFAWAPSSGITPDGYVLEGGADPGSDPVRLHSPGSGTILTVSAPVGIFHVRVRATLGEAESEPSPEIKINLGVPEPPSSPAGLLGLADGLSVTLAWQNTFNGGPPSSIVLDVAGATAGSIRLPLTDRLAFTGVPPGTYTVSVRAANASGASAPSNAVALTFPGSCSPPQVPTNFSVSRIGRTIVSLWSPPAVGSAPSGYLVSVTGSFEGSIPTPGLTLSGAAAPGTYAISVAATNACGTSSHTPPKSVTIP